MKIETYYNHKNRKLKKIKIANIFLNIVLLKMLVYFNLFIV